MTEKIGEPIDVLASFGQGKYGVQVLPHSIRWRNRKYKLEKFGLYHPERRGTKRLHIFSFSCGTVNFRVELDPETLQWTLAEVYYAT